ncbi:GntR family transcriptional regulator [Zhaonella formicivorans]|uniref:GntR family transcriptional regulator n=1 Tax=Zhaonella formicivorans TaxID=2528593 RepID=UPI0010DCB6E4|nr:GntR family transcriptional regulator [Zhaonella formicivorans]
MDISRIEEKGLSQLAKKSIYKYIKSMDLNVSNKLPREEVLAEKIGVSRITVRSALNELASEGIIFRKQGKGTFVNKEALQIKVTFNPIDDLRFVILNSGYNAKVETVNIKARASTIDEANKLQVKHESKIFVIEKIFYADDYPAVYCIDRIPAESLEGTVSFDDMTTSIYEFLRLTLGKIIIWDKVELSTITSEELRALSPHFKCTDGKSFLNCDVINYDQEDNPVLYTNEYIDTNYIRFNMIRQKKFSFKDK